MGERRACTITPREKEIIHLTASGKAEKEIAQALKISAHTVKAYRKPFA